MQDWVSELKFQPCHMQYIGFSKDVRNSLRTLMGRRPELCHYYKLYNLRTLDQEKMLAVRKQVCILCSLLSSYLLSCIVLSGFWHCNQYWIALISIFFLISFWKGSVFIPLLSADGWLEVNCIMIMSGATQHLKFFSHWSWLQFQQCFISVLMFVPKSWYMIVDFAMPI